MIKQQSLSFAITYHFVAENFVFEYESFLFYMLAQSQLLKVSYKFTIIIAVQCFKELLIRKR